MADVENSNAYKIGKLLAIAGNCQYHSSDGKTDTVIGEFWTKLSTNPYNYVSSLHTKIIKAYVSNIKKKNYGQGINMEKEISSIISGLDLSNTKPFSNKEKLEFIFGFETQRNNYFNKTKDSGNFAKIIKKEGE